MSMIIKQIRYSLQLILSVCLILIFAFEGQAQDNKAYQMPPKVLAELADVPPSPDVDLGPKGKWMLFTQRPSMPSITEVAQPELRIAGLRINPRTNGPSRVFYYAISASFMSIEDKKSFDINGLPDDPRLTYLSWSPDGKKIAFIHTVDKGMELWMVSLETMNAQKLTGPVLNGAMRGSPFEWSPDSKSILYKSVVADRGSAPSKAVAPEGPVITENVGVAAPNRTYQDLIKSPYDESLFEYYASSQLMKVDLEGKSEKLGNKGIIAGFDPSPDGNYIMVNSVKKPFSYLVPYYRFAQEVNILDSEGNQIAQIADIPLAEDIPKGFDAVRKGPRSHSWRDDAPATIVWAEALDEGDPKNKVAHRDQVYMMNAPFTGMASKGPALSLRYAGIDWGNDEMAVVYENWWSSRRRIANIFDPSNPEAEGKLIYDRSTEDRYTNPGNFISTTNQEGRSVLKMDTKGKFLYLRGPGYSPEGARPFIDAYNIANGKTERIWQSEGAYYEYPVSIMDEKASQILTRRESKTVPPNYFMRNVKDGKLDALTNIENPYQQFKNVSKEAVSYKRKDGVSLSGTLYLPPGYKPEDGPLPTFIWAYPREFKNAAAAGQRTDSPYRFSNISAWSPYLFVMKGIAVLDGASMPIIGEGEKEPNDSFVEQLVMNAEAAIDYLVDKGVTDRDRVGIGGHSYGAFMTANLLAHSDLFACGIARSGAYNRTLTPFGFQREERTFWEAPELYFRMSPFMHAQKVKEPILLIHGQADNNSGTFPMQSERYYNALKGHGATARLVMLPHESHGYRARESLMHMLYEMDQWLEKYINQKQ